MNKKELAGWSIAALTAPTLLGALTMGVTIGGATGADNDTGTEASSQSASVTSVVVTEELCTWYMLGAPSAISLTTNEPGMEYEGPALSLSATMTHSGSLSMNVYASGNQTGGQLWGDSEYSECTFYGVKSRPIVTVTVEDYEFTAEAADRSVGGVTYAGGPDSAMSFSASVDRPIALDFTTRAATCTGYTLTDISFTGSTLWAAPIKISSLDTVTTPVNSSGDSKRCSQEYTISATVPAELNPTYPGNTYTWTGPSIVFSLRTTTTND